MRLGNTGSAKFSAGLDWRGALPGVMGLLLAGAAQAQPAVSQAGLQAAWRAAIAHAAVPGAGCFTAAYPAIVWKQVACTNAPARAYAPARHPAVGFGQDFAAMVSGAISAAVGSFSSITGLVAEKSAGVANQYSLQMNVPYFSSATCKSSPYAPGCSAWQQFVFSQSGGKGGGSSAFMVYWLINYGPYCPSGWSQAALNCYINSAAVQVPHQTLGALAGLTLSGAAAKGGNDTVTLTTAKKAYAVSAADSALGLAGSWTGTEFNVLGDGAGSQANFNTGTDITVNIALTDGATTAPGCRTNEIFTYETNNLTLGKCTTQSGKTPSVTFTETD